MKTQKQIEHKYEIGDTVLWINDYGVNLGKRTIIKQVELTGTPSYMIEPHDAHWCSVREENLHKITNATNVD